MIRIQCEEGEAAATRSESRQQKRAHRIIEKKSCKRTKHRQNVKYNTKN